MAPDVFLSYSHADVEWAEKLRKELEERGISVLSDREVKPGDNWALALENAVKAAKTVILVIGPKGAEGLMQELEWQVALEATWKSGGKRLIPVFVDDAKVPPFLRGWDGLHLDGGSKNWKNAVERIADAISSDKPAKLKPPTAAERAQQRSRLEYIEDFARALKSGASSVSEEKSRD